MGNAHNKTYVKHAIRAFLMPSNALMAAIDESNVLSLEINISGSQ